MTVRVIKPARSTHRYCQFCDEWFSVKHVECPTCGAPTIRAAASPKPKEQ